MNLINFTNNGACSCCGECCTDFLHLDNEEIKKIDDYLKDNKLPQHNKGENNFKCPFRNDMLHKCDIYEVRPYICRLFKCDTPPEKARCDRDELNKNKKIRSMAELFFKDSSKIAFIKQFNIKVYKRGE